MNKFNTATNMEQKNNEKEEIMNARGDKVSYPFPPEAPAWVGLTPHVKKLCKNYIDEMISWGIKIDIEDYIKWKQQQIDKTQEDN
ncbi:MAG: hypothetical protein IMY67_12280 [Bacteroidetes bacterium]|nr:hypothetical protein [Bacteroidota bacterium]